MVYGPNQMTNHILWVDVPGTGGLKIKCLMQGAFDNPLAIVLHGKPGKPDGLVNDETATFFTSRGISCLRPFMYSTDASTRDLADCTLESYVQDFATLVAYVRGHNPPKLFAIGHSYGALAILKSPISLDAAVLWEPTHGSYWTEYPGLQRDKSRPLNEFEALGDTTALAAHKGYPLKILSAGQGTITEFHKRYFAVADEPKAHVVIAGARHNLGDRLEILNEVRQQTADWLLRFS